MCESFTQSVFSQLISFPGYVIERLKYKNTLKYNSVKNENITPYTLTWK